MVALPWLRVSSNHRFLERDDGIPFFWLGDTAWEVFHRLTIEDAELYLRDRAEKGFNVIQAVVLAELEALEVPNAYGDVPFEQGNPKRPNERYFRHVDSVIDLAEDLGLYIALIPTWGSYVTDKQRQIFDEDTIAAYGCWLGHRYAGRSNIIWVVGGDRLPVQVGEYDVRDVWRSLAGSLRESSDPRHLMTFHPPGGGRSSSEWFHDEPWLDFNMMQTGPRRDLPNFAQIEQDYRLKPVKPVLDGEPGYEGAHPNIRTENGRLTDYDVRRYAYWATFAGAFGHTYGCLEIWQMWIPGSDPRNGARIPWIDALDLAGARQMAHLKRLMESRHYWAYVPDQSLIAAGQGTLADHVGALRSADGRSASIYIAGGQPITVDLGKLAGRQFRVSWYDPRHGRHLTSNPLTAGMQSLQPPLLHGGPDWVLTVDSLRADSEAQ